MFRSILNQLRLIFFIEKDKNRISEPFLENNPFWNQETKKIPMQVNSKQLAQVRFTPEGS